jgi:single-strand DNA-binding protein
METVSRGNSPLTSPGINAVVLEGRLSGEVAQRELPSGDTLVSFRVVVDRPPGDRSRQRVDALECVAWSPRVRRSAARWCAGDVVHVEGAVRRRFFRAGQAAASRVEIEVVRARVVRRAASA